MVWPRGTRAGGSGGLATRDTLAENGSGLVEMTFGGPRVYATGAVMAPVCLGGSGGRSTGLRPSTSGLTETSGGVVKGEECSEECSNE